MSKILIVESENDQAVIQAVINHMNLPTVRFDAPICQIDDYECLGGLNKNKLVEKLDSLRIELQKESKNIEAIGIILDVDGKRTERLKLINDAIAEVFETTTSFTNTHQWITVMVDELNLKLSCFLMGVGDTGELETVLKAIKAKSSTYADCLESWQGCLQDNSIKPVSQKEFDKFWLSNYLRFDTCSKDEQKQAHRKCNLVYAMEHEKDIFNFDHPVLDELKNFLRLFTELKLHSLNRTNQQAV